MNNLPKGTLIWHPEYGTGQVQSETDNEIEAVFKESQGPLYLDADEVNLVAEDGFRFLAYHDQPGAAELVAGSPVEAIKLLLKDHPGQEVSKDDIYEGIKKFVVDWDTWWSQVQQQLKHSLSIDTSRSRDGKYSLAEQERSRIEELYESFKISPNFTKQRKRPVVNLSKLRDARNLLEELSKTSEYPEIKRHVKDYLITITHHDGVPVAERVDIVIRLAEKQWLGDEEVVLTLEILCVRPIKIYELGQFAQNRILDALQKHVDSNKRQDSMLTAFATDESFILKVIQLYLEQKQEELLIQGLWTGLQENLPSEISKDQLRSWYRSFASRLRGLRSLLNTIVTRQNLSVDWEKLARYLSQLFEHLSGTDRTEEIPEDILYTLIEFLWQVLKIAPPEFQSLYLDIPLSLKLRPTLAGPITMSILKSDPALGFFDTFFALTQHQSNEQLSNVLQAVLEQARKEDTYCEILPSLIEQLSNNTSILKLITEDVLTTVQDTPDGLISYLPILGQLAKLGPDFQWSAKVSQLRKDGFQRICQAVNDDQPLRFQAFIFDHQTLSGLHNFLKDLRDNHQQLLVEQQAQTENARTETQLTLKKLHETEAALSELRQGYRQPEREIRFTERRQILEALAIAAGEFERFAHSTQSREMVGVTRRINRLLRDFEVDTYGKIGEEVEFDPTKHEFIGDAASVKTVTIIEPGYIIYDLTGRSQLLKPAKVSKK